MEWNFVFFLNSILLGVGLAMDAFSVSLANGLNEPKMSIGRVIGISGIFALFQFLMPMTGWICVHTIVQYFSKFQIVIPWIALVLLSYIGGKMLIEALVEIKKYKKCKFCTANECQQRHNKVITREGIEYSDGCEEKDLKKDENLKRLAVTGLLLQGIATSIDALSVGFTIEQYGLIQALVSSFIIGIVTWGICIGGLKIGKVVGTKLSTKAGILGGAILLGIGIEIFVSGIFF